MKRIIVFLSLTITTLAFAENTYDQFNDIFDQGERVATIEDLRKIDKCFVSSDDSQNSVFEFGYKNYYKEIDQGPVLGIERVEYFQIGTGMIYSFHLNEKTFDKWINDNTLIFGDKTQTAKFRYGYEGKNILLVKLVDKTPAGNDRWGDVQYHVDYFVGQCTLKE